MQCIIKYHTEPRVKFQDEVPQAENGTGSIPVGEISDIITEPITQTEDNEVPVQGGAQPTQDRPHKLWLPEKQPHLADLVLALKRAKQQQQIPVAATPLQELESQTISSLKTRQQLLMERIRATQAVLPQKVYRLQDEAKPDKGNASKRKFVRQESNLKVSDDVSEYLKRRAGSAADIASTIQGTSEAVTSSVPKAEPVLRFDSQLSTGPSVKCGSMSLSKWREVIKNNKPYFSSVDSEDGLKDSSQHTHID